MARSPTLSTLALGVAAFAAAMLIAPRRAPVTESGVAPPGRRKQLKTRALEAGARVFQATPPLDGFDIYLVGFHPMKDDPHHQMEAHHFCRQVNQDFMQCVLFDGNTAEANLTGIEYIISERLFETLPGEERRFWHPHNGEIISGQLIAPNIPEAAERALMSEKMNSYGKTWHLWDTGGPGRQGKELPTGEPMLAWSFNREGEAIPDMIKARDLRMGVSTELRRRAREALVALAHAQEGVDTLKGRFPRPTVDLPGVRDKRG